MTLENEAIVASANDIVCAALDVGEHILKNGGEIHRVEDTVDRICRSFGAAHVEVFTINSLIVASARMENGEYSQQMRRIYKTANNLYMVEEMNRISRELCAHKLQISDLRAAILEAKEKKPYKAWLMYVASMLAAGGFAIFFGGSVIDGLCAGAVGMVVTFLGRHTPRFMNKMIVTVISSLVGGLLGILLSRLIPGSNADMVMIGTIMLLIPGISLGNSVRDMLEGDVISGALGIIQSILLALMIAFGYAVAITVMGGVA
ncbi:MAG: threonine/serine exporter family protein [Clostridia bacterium]|nr:threonine/serine exporter family protein [Clostridia bacterium]